jgi:hypothetical protein
MTDEEYEDFQHKAVHTLIDLNREYCERFRIDDYGRWDYDQGSGLFTFSDEGTVKVVCNFEFVGSFSSVSHSWMWAWANDSFDERFTLLSQKTKDFGMEHGISKLITDYWEGASEDDGWKMAAVTTVLGNAVGAYKCPSEKGCSFAVFKDIRFATH